MKRPGIDERLRESEEKYRTLFNSIFEGFCVIEVFFDENNVPIDYRFLEISPSFETQTGIKDAVGKTIRELVPQLEQYWFKMYGEVALTGNPARFENEVAQLHHWYEVHASRIGEPGERKVAVVFSDITERKHAQQEIQKLNADLERRVLERTAQLEAANKELEAFTYSVSHDLRAPLRHISGFSKMLVEEFSPALPPEAQHYLERIQGGTRRMGLLVDDLLNLGRVGRQALRIQLAGMQSIVEEVIAELQPEYVDREVEWKIGTLPFLDCDPGLLKQVFQNLLSNALKFTRPRAAAVIEVGQKEEGDSPVIYVRDNGVGFSMQYSGKLFGVFQRLHRQEDFEGTGVGLATVQRIITKHGGRIWAEAELDKGAAFYFTIGGTERNEIGTKAAVVGEKV